MGLCRSRGTQVVCTSTVQEALPAHSLLCDGALSLAVSCCLHLDAVIQTTVKQQSQPDQISSALLKDGVCAPAQFILLQCPTVLQVSAAVSKLFSLLLFLSYRTARVQAGQRERAPQEPWRGSWDLSEELLHPPRRIACATQGERQRSRAGCAS